MYDEQILQEFPQEFQNLKNIEILVRAFARQLDELHAASAELKRLCDLDSAQGKQLDGIGDIVVLSRSDAMRLIKGPITYDIMDDAHYRHYLLYKILKNTSTCTYYDIITAVQMLWGAEDIAYFEDPAEPATVTLTFPDPGGAVQLDDIPPIIAAGVGVHIRATSKIRISQTLFFGACAGIHEKQMIAPASFRRTIRQRLYTESAAAVFQEACLDICGKDQGRSQSLSLNAGLFHVIWERAQIDLPHVSRPVTIRQKLSALANTGMYEEVGLGLRGKEQRRSYRTSLYTGPLTITKERTVIDLDRRRQIPRLTQRLAVAAHNVLFNEAVVRPSNPGNRAFTVHIMIGSITVLHEAVLIKLRRRTPIEH